jgi:hypothetical protein
VFHIQLVPHAAEVLTLELRLGNYCGVLVLKPTEELVTFDKLLLEGKHLRRVVGRSFGALRHLQRCLGLQAWRGSGDGSKVLWPLPLLWSITDCTGGLKR